MQALAVLAGACKPGVAHGVAHPWFGSETAILPMWLFLFPPGWLAAWVIGQRNLRAFDALMAKIPFVKMVSGSTGKLVDILRERRDRIQRLVLIDFPSPDMKMAGFTLPPVTLSGQFVHST